MNATSEIRSAIERSSSHDEIVRLTIEGDSGDALDQIREVFDGDIDYVMCDHEGVDTLDVWGVSPDTPENEMDWRLAIRFNG